MSQEPNKTVAMKKPLDTGFLKKNNPSPEPPAPQTAAPATAIYTGSNPTAAAAGTTEKHFMHDPVVGWVVVIDGPGQGISLPLGNGNNSLGRGSNQRVALDFGDANLSRDSHATITYDPRGRKFYLHSGGNSTNLTYLEGAGTTIPVLAPVVLENGQHLRLGNTTLKFVALCGDGFGWDAADAGA